MHGWPTPRGVQLPLHDAGASFEALVAWLGSRLIYGRVYPDWPPMNQGWWRMEEACACLLWF
jgi:hypothetical protein